MSKPLVFVKARVRIDGLPGEVDSWELISFGDSPIMHAAWNPLKEMLALQVNSVKENFVDYPVQQKTGKVSMQERRAQLYYRIVIQDKDAIQYILDNFVGNYNGQEWDLKVDPPMPTRVQQEDSKPSLIED